MMQRSAGASAGDTLPWRDLSATFRFRTSTEKPDEDDSMSYVSGIALAIVTLLASTLSALSQTASWPTKAVHWTNTAAPGSSGDIMARIVADRLAAMWGQPIIHDNRPGAAGNLAAQAAARSEPDGYHFFFAVASTLAVNPYTFASLPFDAERDFVPVVMIGFSPFMFAVNPAVPVNTMADLIALAKKQPGASTFSTFRIAAARSRPTTRSRDAPRSISTACRPCPRISVATSCASSPSRRRRALPATTAFRPSPKPYPVLARQDGSRWWRPPARRPRCWRV